MDIHEKLKKFIKKRPDVVAAFGYGSGVFKQTGYDDKSLPQIDMILVAEDVRRWHKENKKKNPGDYSWTGACILPGPLVTKLSGKTHIIYQSNIEEEGGVYKYGIISREDFFKCMTTWESFYVPGRFQKPLLPIVMTSEVEALLWNNRKGAIIAAASFLPEETSCFDLYMHVCSLSYFGDSRMYIAENPEKVRNIVTGSYDRIHEIYLPVLESSAFLQVDTGKEKELTIERKALSAALKQLPESLQKYLQEQVSDWESMEEVSRGIRTYLEKVNFGESVGQTAKGLVSNGLIRSIAYVIPKLKKKFGSKK